MDISKDIRNFSTMEKENFSDWLGKHFGHSRLEGAAQAVRNMMAARNAKLTLLTYGRNVGKRYYQEEILKRLREFNPNPIVAVIDAKGIMWIPLKPSLYKRSKYRKRGKASRQRKAVQKYTFKITIEPLDFQADIKTIAAIYGVTPSLIKSNLDI